MRKSADRRVPLTDPKSRTWLGLFAAACIVPVDVWVDGLHPLRCAVIVVAAPLGMRFLTPIADLSTREPLKAGVLAALMGAGAGALWWASFSPVYSIWVVTSIGACVALYSLAPMETRSHRRRTDPPPKRPALAARLRRLLFKRAISKHQESSPSKRHSAQSQPSV